MNQKKTNVRTFGSDNFSPAHPDILAALQNANSGHVRAYGGDPYTVEACSAFDSLFGKKVFPFFCFNGTGANSSVLTHLTHRFGAILCTKTGHINCDECGAVEHFSSCKIISFASPDGKLKPSMLSYVMEDVNVQHKSQPEVVFISQSTEVGTVYQPEEVREICDWAHSHGLKVFMDGARISNAAAVLKCPIADFTVDAGVDVMVFGGTKNGLVFGEAVIFFDPLLAKSFEFTRKNCGQLYSKHRFISAQFTALLKNDLWLEMGRKANEKAKYFVDKLKKVPGIVIVYPVEANEIFLRFPPALRGSIKTIKEKYSLMSEEPEVYRLVCSFDTEQSEIDEFITFISETKSDIVISH